MKGLKTGLSLISLLALGPAAAAGPAIAGQDTATVSAGFVHIRGPEKLKPRKRLEIPIRCSVDCHIKVTTRLVLPGPNVGPTVTTGDLSPTAPRNLILTLNDLARDSLRKHFDSARLKVRVSAVDIASGASASDRKTFRFKRP